MTETTPVSTGSGSEFVVKVVSRSGRALGTFSLTDASTLRDLKALYAQKSKLGPERQYFTRAAPDPKDRALKGDGRLVEMGVRNGDTLTFKDLGYQIDYRTVFYVEYAGPVLLHALFYFCQEIIYGQSFNHVATQKIAFACVVFHYVKRELESAFVHQFSNDTMPWTNIFKNSAHYWMLGGAFIAYFLYHPKYSAPFPDTAGSINVAVMACVIVFVLAELGNLHAHLTLKSLRPPGTKRRAIPMGGLFSLVACPNYTFEVLAWLAFCIFTQTLTGYLFLVVSTVQMMAWAKKKHNQYKADFPDAYPPLRRKKMFPFLW